MSSWNQIRSIIDSVSDQSLQDSTIRRSWSKSIKLHNIQRSLQLFRIHRFGPRVCHGCHVTSQFSAFSQSALWHLSNTRTAFIWNYYMLVVTGSSLKEGCCACNSRFFFTQKSCFADFMGKNACESDNFGRNNPKKLLRNPGGTDQYLSMYDGCERIVKKSWEKQK